MVSCWLERILDKTRRFPNSSSDVRNRNAFKRQRIRLRGVERICNARTPVGVNKTGTECLLGDAKTFYTAILARTNKWTDWTVRLPNQIRLSSKR